MPLVCLAAIVIVVLNDKSTDDIAGVTKTPSEAFTLKEKFQAFASAVDGVRVKTPLLLVIDAS